MKHKKDEKQNGCMGQCDKDQDRDRHRKIGIQTNKKETYKDQHKWKLRKQQH